MVTILNPYIPNVAKFEASKEFSYLAEFFNKHDCYTNLPRGTYEYKLFWEDVRDKCLDGFTNSKGIRITGAHFFYLNFCRISGFDENVGKKVEMFPRFIDLDYEYFHMIEYCEVNEMCLIAVKGRRQGWSYKAAAICAHEFSFFPGSSSIIGTFFSSYGTETMKMCKDNLNWLNANTEFRKQRNPDLSDYVMSRYQVDVSGIKVWKGYKSQVRSISFKDNPTAAVGKSASKLILDEAGVFPNITDTYGYTEPLIKAGSRYSGVSIIFGSSGDMDSGSKYFYEMFTNPEKYNLLSFEDPEDPSKKIGFFSSALKGHEGYCKNPHSPWYKKDLIDEDGNSNLEATYDHIMFLRDKAKGGLDPKALHSIITQFPTTWKEAFLRNKGAIFASPEMLDWLGKLETTPSIRNSVETGHLVFKDGKMEFQPSDEVNYITDFPLKPDVDNTGCVALFERPEFLNGEIPYGLYVAGCLTPGEKVLTDKGLMNVEDVTSNEKLINKDGDEVEINTFLKYDKIDEPVFKVNMSSVDRPTTYTQEHPLYLSNTVDGNYDFIKAKDAKVGMWTKYPNVYNKVKQLDLNIWDNYKQPNSPRIDNPLEKEDFWWFIGHWLGDGFSYKHGKNHDVYNCFDLEELEYIEKYKLIVKNTFNRNPNHKKQNGSGTHCFGSSQLYYFLEDNFGKYANGKFIADWVKYIPHNLKLQLILGYLDSDGSVYTDAQKHTICSFKSINKILLNDVQDILFSIGILSRFNKSTKPSKYNINGKIGNTKQAYSLKINTTELKKLSDKYLIDHNSRKLRAAKDIVLLQAVRKNTSCIMSEDSKYIFIKIKTIEESTYTGIVYNFDCVTHTFLCQYCTTHNCDPYDQDKSSVGSLGSFFVYKRFYHAGKTHDMLVAEYTGRPKFADDFYENCRKLCIYFNAKCLYENNLKGLKGYFEQKNALHYLYEQPGIIRDIVKDSKVQRGYGIHVTRGSGGSSGIKDTMELYLKDWLYTEREDIDGNKILNLHTIKSIALLKELIAYDMEGNYDRCIALMLCILQAKDIHRIHVQNMNGSSSSFSNDPFLKKVWEKQNIAQENRFTFNKNKLIWNK